MDGGTNSTNNESDIRHYLHSRRVAVWEGDVRSDVVIVVAAPELVVVAAVVVVESDDRSFQECQILKYHRLSRSTYQDSRYAALCLPFYL